MKKRIAIGGENFIRLRLSDSYYVDKTGILYELFHEMNNTATLFLRPPHFGKTMLLSMADSFFNIEKKEERSVFDGLTVMKHADFCKENMNQYPVLFISLKDVEGTSFDFAFDQLKAVIADWCKEHIVLLQNHGVNDADKKIFERLLDSKASRTEVVSYLKTLMRMMNDLYGKRVILLVDDYDAPLVKAAENGYYNEMLEVMQSLFNISLKTNDYLERAVMTGCLPTPAGTDSSGFNHVVTYSVRNKRFSEYFGFTTYEVKKMLTDYNLTDHADEIKEWCGGYCFGNTQVYCSWDVMNYVAALRRRKEALPLNCRENTSGNDAISAFLDMPDINVSDKFETLLNGGTIDQSVTNALTYDNAYATEDNLWSILLMTGYVTTVPQGTRTESVDEGEQTIGLRIPNREISGIFQSAVVDHFRKSVNKNEIHELMEALWNGNEEKASEILSDLLWNTISYMDYGEDYYHAFLTGIFVGRGGYSVQSNKEQGLGRPDIDLRDRPNRRAIIIEAKKSESKDRMGYWCDQALKQIEEKGYAKNLDGYRQILCYGIGFYKKEALVKKAAS